jgi:hypothetical protein
MNSAGLEIDCFPTQSHKLCNPQPMPIGDQGHGGVTMSVPIIAGGFDQPLNLGIGEVFPAPEGGVRLAFRRLSEAN